MNETTTPTQTVTAQPNPAAERLDHTQKHLMDYRQNIDHLLRFIDANEKQLAGLDWSACHIYRRIEIEASGQSRISERDPRKIARRWPGVVWTRQKNIGTCGVLDWHGAVAGMPVIIRNAEAIRWIPVPNTEVET